MQTKKCPVCGWEIKDGGVQVTVGGKEVTVCCNGCARLAQQAAAPKAGAGE